VVKKQEKQEKDENFHHFSPCGKILWQFLPHGGTARGSNPGRFDAIYKKGVLKLVLKKIRESDAKKNRN